MVDGSFIAAAIGVVRGAVPEGGVLGWAGCGAEVGAEAADPGFSVAAMGQRWSGVAWLFVGGAVWLWAGFCGWETPPLASLVWTRSSLVRMVSLSPKLGLRGVVWCGCVVVAGSLLCLVDVVVGCSGAPLLFSVVLVSPGRGFWLELSSPSCYGHLENVDALLFSPV